MGVFQIFCKQKIVGKAWAVIQRRLDNSVDFYRDWGDYKRGFGHLNGSFWLGLEKIHRLTNQKHQNKLRVELEEFAGSRCYAEYDNFTVNGENDGYRLARLGFYQGIYVFSSFQTISSLCSLPNLAGIQLKKCHTNGKTRERSGRLFLWSWLALTCAPKFIPKDNQNHCTCPIMPHQQHGCLLLFSVFLGLERWTGQANMDVCWLWKRLIPFLAFYSLFVFFSTGTGSCVDSLNYNRGATFSTKDKDSDSSPGSNCAVDHQGAWWYKSCTGSNLNGLYSPTGHDITGIYWYQKSHGIVHLKKVEMMLELVE